MSAEEDQPSGEPGGDVFSRYSENKCPSQRPEWLVRLEDETEPFRKKKAMDHRGKARHARLTNRLSSAEWHEPRVGGQLGRFEQIYSCGTKEIHLRCQGCNAEVYRRIARCGHRRVCLCCRSEYARRQQARFRPARQEAMAGAAAMFWDGAPGGRWSERFLTLTQPHGDNVGQDIKALVHAWKVFRKLVWEHLALDRGFSKSDLRLLAFVRVLEVTPGTRGDGHAHIHAWMLGPFIHHELLRHLWGKAIRKNGYEPPTRPLAQVLEGAGKRRAQLEKLLVTRRGARAVADVDWPIIDVRAAENVEAELIKYLVKDAEREGTSLRLMDPALFALIYQGLEDVRSIATSRHFWPESQSALACECGCTFKRTHIVRPETPPPDASKST